MDLNLLLPVISVCFTGYSCSSLDCSTRYFWAFYVRFQVVQHQWTVWARVETLIALHTWMTGNACLFFLCPQAIAHTRQDDALTLGQQYGHKGSRKLLDMWWPWGKYPARSTIPHILDLLLVCSIILLPAVPSCASTSLSIVKLSWENAFWSAHQSIDCHRNGIWRIFYTLLEIVGCGPCGQTTNNPSLITREYLYANSIRSFRFCNEGHAFCIHSEVHWADNAFWQPCFWVFRPEFTICWRARVVDVYLICIADVGPSNILPFEALAAHNHYRSEVGVPDLQWSNALMEGAQQWAKHLADTNSFCHSGRGGCKYGECLWMGTTGAFTYTQMVDAWGREKQYFKNGNFPDVSTTGNWRDVGHYTQVVWRNTREIGCGIADGTDGHSRFVCWYNPAGNVRGQPVYLAPMHAQQNWYHVAGELLDEQGNNSEVETTFGRLTGPFWSIHIGVSLFGQN